VDEARRYSDSSGLLLITGPVGRPEARGASE
jgi:hypothetical protein